MLSIPLFRRHALYGTGLITLGLLAGFSIPLAANRETVLAAHVIGLTTGMVAILFGLLLAQTPLGSGWKRICEGLLVVSLFVGFFTQWLGGLFGLSRMFIVTAIAQAEGPAWAETAVELLIKGISPMTVLPFLILLVGLAKAPAARTAPAL